MLKIYTYITGDDYNLLKDETPQSKKKVKLLAFCIMIPVVFWAVNSFLLASNILMKDLYTSLVVMAIASILIFFIEKIIVMTNGGWQIALFRIFLGFIIALIGSLALEEVIFKNDIDTQMSENQRKYISENLEIKNIELNIEKTKMENIIIAKDSVWKEAVNEAVGEIDGTRGSNLPYRGPIAELKLQKANELKLDREISSSQLDLIKSSNDSTLAKYESELKNGFEMNSLLLRIKALFDLVGKDKYMMGFYILFTLLVFFMEIIVIIVKMFSKETNYEKKMKMIEQIGEKRMNLILENNSSLYDNLLFKGEMNKSMKIINQPLNGTFSRNINT